jgi:hypothetical protein
MASMTEISRKISTFAVLAAVALALAACETDGSSPGPLASLSSPSKPAEPEKPAEPPMTRSRAASECWMSTEKGPLRSNLDKRADAVDKCIADKMKSVAAAPKS